jgi:hypothetical protein
VVGRGILLGGASGLVSGLASGVILHFMWVLAPFPLLVARPPSVVTGWVVHLVMSGVAGMIFGAIVEPLNLTGRQLLLAGMLTGVALFLLGPVTLVPAIIGLRPQFPVLNKWLKVGAAYLALGAVLGAAYSVASKRPLERQV